MQTNNRLIKQICENYNITVEGTHTDNYYLRKIATEKFNCSYSELESNNKYLKDIAEAITGSSYSETHFDNFYLKKIAEFLSSETYGKNFDNFYLKIWANGEVPPTPTFDGVSLSVDESTIVYGESVTLTAQLTSDGSPFSVEGETVSFYNGATLLGTDDTDSTGVATFTSSNFDVGSHSVTGVCDEYTSNSVSVTVDKLTPSISLSVPATGTMGSAYTISGTLVPSSGEVKLYEDNTLIDTLSVTGGVFSKSITQNSEGTYSYYVVFEGSSTYNSVTSNTSSIVITKLPVEYQEVEYIENTGTSYIDTGFKPNNNT